MTPRAGLLLLALAPCASAADITSGEMRASFRLWDEGVRAVLKDDRAAARDKWQRCLKVDPDNKDCRAGLKLLGTSKPAGARSVPSAAAPPTADRDERGALGEWHRGVIAFQKMDYEAAREAWEKCLRLDPRNVDCGVGLERVGSAGRGRLPGSPVPPRRADDHERRGQNHFQAGRYAQAGDEWQKCLQRDPRNTVCQAGLRLARGRAAGTAAPASEELKRSALRHWNAGIIYFQNGDYKRARDEWLLCRQLDEDNQDCQTGLQRIDSTFSP